MPDLSYEPPVPTTLITSGFVQTIRLTAANKPVGIARWYVGGDAHDGVVQILELTVGINHRRQLYGQQLYDAMLEQVRRFFKAHKIRPRRIWANIEQKDQVVGRAFLTKQGYHHVATIPTLLKDQDAMVYLVSLD
jgi:ribosomal protein S18 acetylase RimI-like enzyme